ncbi:DDHD domain-containingprotein [Purpureocillium lavendulum]|uniref:DDHD domain-containingprotein n=1 Tax=Purpureocillium lavendulum TaxID=1247861 RepID=A0AB34FP56_9HYPO|nr:DDHD domain-containingprotein [Purpureocillium lavendulum]
MEAIVDITKMKAEIGCTTETPWSTVACNPRQFTVDATGSQEWALITMRQLSLYTPQGCYSRKKLAATIRLPAARSVTHVAIQATQGLLDGANEWLEMSTHTYLAYHVVKGTLTDKDALDAAVSESRVVVSLLGPNTLRYINPGTFTDFYESLFLAMRKHEVKRIFAMSTLSYGQSQDSFSAVRWLLISLVFFVGHFAWRTARSIGWTFEERAADLDWTVFRIAALEGASDEASWRTGREDGESYEGWIGKKGWSASQNRAALTRWLVDAVENGKGQWIGKMPAVSRLAGSGKVKPS